MKPDPKQTARAVKLLAKRPEGLTAVQIAKSLGYTPKKAKVSLTAWHDRGLLIPVQAYGTCYWLASEYVAAYREAHREAQREKRRLTDPIKRRHKKAQLIEVSDHELEHVQRSMVAANEAAPIRTTAPRWVFEWRPAA